MRSLATLLLCAGCATNTAVPVAEPRDPPCDPVTSTFVRHRTEGAFTVVEMHSERIACSGPGSVVVEPVARIALATATPACPVGQVALRSWNRGHGSEKVLAAFLDALDRNSRAELSQALIAFADAAEAYVVACPMAGHADWLFVETMPRETPTRVQFFVGNELRLERRHPQVTFAGEQPPPPAPAPSVVEPTLPDCSEPAGTPPPRWLARFYSTGMMPGPEWMRTYAFSRDGDRATLVFQSKSSRKARANQPRGDWECKQSMRTEGTVVERGKQLVFSLSEPGKPDAVFEVTCAVRSLRVANADAVRIEIPSNQEGCHKHKWSPAASKRVAVLECTMGETRWPGWQDEVVFAAPTPGVEHLTLDEDDCFDPKDSLRRIPRDGGFAPAK